MLTVEPSQRPTLEQVLRHQCMKQRGECSLSPPAELLPQILGTSIILAMRDLGYGYRGTGVSINQTI